MSRFDRIRNLFYSARKISSYNLKIVFANKFVYFLLAAFLFFLAAGAISFFSSDSNPGPHDVYYILSGVTATRRLRILSRMSPR